MKIVKPYAKMTAPLYFNLPFTPTDGKRCLQVCEYAARVSHRSEELITNESYDKFLRFVVLQHGDFSVIEHANVTVEAVVDRGITHEWVRHRLGAYTQESTRFVNYEKKMEPSFICPLSEDDRSNIENWENAIFACEDSYIEMIRKGVKPQIARSVFPNALASKLIVTYNLRMWRHFFLMRTNAEAHPQMREVTIPLLKEFQEKIPIIYEDIVPESKQSENLKKMR